MSPLTLTISRAGPPRWATNEPLNKAKIRIEARHFMRVSITQKGKPPEGGDNNLKHQQASDHPSWTGGVAAASRKWREATLAPQTGWWIQKSFFPTHYPALRATPPGQEGRSLAGILSPTATSKSPKGWSSHPSTLRLPRSARAAPNPAFQADSRIDPTSIAAITYIDRALPRSPSLSSLR